MAIEQYVGSIGRKAARRFGAAVEGQAGRQVRRWPASRTHRCSHAGCWRRRSVCHRGSTRGCGHRPHWWSAPWLRLRLRARARCRPGSRRRSCFRPVKWRAALTGDRPVGPRSAPIRAKAGRRRCVRLVMQRSKRIAAAFRGVIEGTFGQLHLITNFVPCRTQHANRTLGTMPAHARTWVYKAPRALGQAEQLGARTWC